MLVLVSLPIMTSILRYVPTRPHPLPATMTVGLIQGKQKGLQVLNRHHASLFNEMYDTIIADHHHHHYHYQQRGRRMSCYRAEQSTSNLSDG